MARKFDIYVYHLKLDRDDDFVALLCRRVLASASDDLHVILWDPYRYKQLHNLATGHSGNIFSVKVRLLPPLLNTCELADFIRVLNINIIL